MLPLILGLLGWLYQLKRDKKSSLVSTLLFFFTGIAIILYLNQAGNQPRERDYAFVGSFYAFAIWIGLGVLFVNELFSRLIKNSFSAGTLAGLVCLFAVPVQMAFVEWDDHDRSQKKITIDLARDYLESCPPNALLVTFGDNDTYPLWYAQEVENVRPDIRVVNYSLLNSDWNINQLTYKINESAPFKMIWTPEQISSNLKQTYSYSDKKKDVQTDLSAFLKDLANRNTSEYFVRSIKLPVDSIHVFGSKIVEPGEKISPSIEFQLQGELTLADAAILNIIAANNWKRPICFTSLQGPMAMGLTDYVRQNGLTYNLVPLAEPPKREFNTVQPFILNHMLNTFKSGNADKKGVYFDEENRRHLISIRNSYADAALAFAQKGTSADSIHAIKLLEKCDQLIDQNIMPYGMVSDYQSNNSASLKLYTTALKVNNKALSSKIANSLEKDYNQQKAYYNSLPERMRDVLSKYEIPYLISAFVNNTKWELSVLKNDSLTQQILNNCKTNQMPIPYLVFNNNELIGFSGYSEFKTKAYVPDFDKIYIDFNSSDNNRGGFISKRYTEAGDGPDLFLENLKNIYSYRFEDHFNTLILLRGNEALIRLKRSF